MGNGDPNANGKSMENEYEYEYDMKGYAVSGKIMLIAIVTLFVVIIIMLCLHVYARWYLLRARRSQHLRRNRNSRRPRLIFYVDPAVRVASRGLDASVIASLPVFAFSPKTHPDPVECAVCLSEFEEGETGRVLPKCNHSFHIDCIDMWFQSHSTCPLCRAPVEAPSAGETEPEVIITVTESEPEPGSSSANCEHAVAGEDVKRSGAAVSCSSCENGKQSSAGEDSGYESSFRSRMLSLKRILSRERKAPSSSVSVGDAEQGRGEETQSVRVSECDDVALMESKISKTLVPSV